MLARRKPVRSGIQRAPKREWPRHEKWVRGFSCVAGRPGEHDCSPKVECCHVRTGTGAGTGIKPCSWWAIPLCSRHHRLQHELGEATFAKRYDIDLRELALKLARMSPDLKMREAMREARLS